MCEFDLVSNKDWLILLLLLVFVWLFGKTLYTGRLSNYDLGRGTRRFVRLLAGILLTGYLVGVFISIRGIYALAC